MSNIKNKSELKKNSKIFDAHKMLFIYNALKNGWTVKMTSNNTYKFTKNRNERVIDSDGFPKEFLLENLNTLSSFTQHHFQEKNIEPSDDIT